MLIKIIKVELVAPRKTFVADVAEMWPAPNFWFSHDHFGEIFRLSGNDPVPEIPKSGGKGLEPGHVKQKLVFSIYTIYTRYTYIGIEIDM